MGNLKWFLLVFVAVNLINVDCNPIVIVVGLTVFCFDSYSRQVLGYENRL